MFDTSILLLKGERNMAKKVFLGVGHGGSDPGAAANGIKEKDANLQIALACEAELMRHGVEVKLSRKKDENDPLTDEIKECNAFNPDYALDIHNNAGGGDGAEVFYHYKGGASKVLAQNVLDAVVAAGQNSRGIKIKLNAQGKDYFGFIRQTKAPAAIVECAFLDNKTDVKIIDSVAEQKAMGIAIAKGILKTLGIAYAEAKKAEAKPEAAEKLYRVQVGAYAVKANAEEMLQRLQKAGFKGVIV